MQGTQYVRGDDPCGSCTWQACALDCGDLGGDTVRLITDVQLPRVITAPTTFNSLLAYPARPNATVVMLQIAKAAGATGDLCYTFGTGPGQRGCLFRPFFEAFVGDLQKELPEP